MGFAGREDSADLLEEIFGFGSHGVLIRVEGVKRNIDGDNLLAISGLRISRNSAGLIVDRKSAIVVEGMAEKSGKVGIAKMRLQVQMLVRKLL